MSFRKPEICQDLTAPLTVTSTHTDTRTPGEGCLPYPPPLPERVNEHEPWQGGGQLGKLGRAQCFSTWPEHWFPNILLLWGRDRQPGRLDTARLRIPVPSVGMAREPD